MAHIRPNEAKTLSGLFQERLKRTPDNPAYRYFKNDQWNVYTWNDLKEQTIEWQTALKQHTLETGDRVAIMMENRPEWVCFDQAALGLGLVTVPLFYNDRADNAAYILGHTDSKVLLTDNAELAKEIQQLFPELPQLEAIIYLDEEGTLDIPQTDAKQKLYNFSEWNNSTPETNQKTLITYTEDPHALATIVYTSGTTGKPKGVMLSHWNILTNSDACLQFVIIDETSTFLSFLPLSHMFERVGGYYLPMQGGAYVTYTRSIAQLAEDLLFVRPTILISVPRIYERIYSKIQEGLEEKSPLAQKLFHLTVKLGNQHIDYRQERDKWRPGFLLLPVLNKLVSQKILDRFGGRLEHTMCGGASLSKPVADLFTGIGLPLLQGFGMTECSPVITANRPDNRIGTSIGYPISGTEVRIAENQELQARSECVMQGYWRNEEATRDTITEEGWLRTGDKARFDEATGHYYIVGRIKEILVLANGEKVPPVEIEAAITNDSLFEQAIVIGEAMPYLSAIVVLNEEKWASVAKDNNFPENDPHQAREFLQQRLFQHLSHFPGYAQIRGVHFCTDPWTVENDMLTPTLKIKRNVIQGHFKRVIDQLYQGHLIK